MSENILDKIDLVQLGQELQAARKRVNLTQDQAAEILGVARTTITAIESGQRRIKAGELIKLARAYNRKVSDFVRPHPKIESFEPQFRSAKMFTDSDTELVKYSVNELEDLSRNYYELEQITGMPMHQNYPPQYSIDGLDIEYAAEDVANRERNRLGLGDGPISNLRKILERDVGLRVFYLDIAPSDRFSAIYAFDNVLGGCIAINRLHPKERRLLSLAHDYAHFLVHRYNADVLISGYYKRVPEHERFADQFAVHFLMPANSVKRQLANARRYKPDITMTDLLTIADYFGVSLEALTRRLEDMREIRSDSWDTIRRSNFKITEARAELGLLSGEGGDDEEKFPHRYQYLALYALEQGLISEGRFARLFQADLVDVNRIASAIASRNEGKSAE